MSSKLYIAKKGNKRRIGILVDLEDCLKYNKCRLRTLPDGRVYFTEKGKKKFLQREILNLTTPEKKVFFKSVNKLDLRKTNLIIREVSDETKGRYAVQFYHN